LASAKTFLLHQLSHPHFDKAEFPSTLA